MEQWLSENLSKHLSFEVPEDLVKYVLSIDKEQDLHEYMKTLLDFENQKHKDFYVELSNKKFHNRGNSMPKQKKKISKSKPQQDFFSIEAPSDEKPTAETQEVESKGKKKTKYVNLYTQEGENAQVVLLKGRHLCDCEASKHELINNCMECGRVVCTQEGSGPCFFCGTLVCTPEEEDQINSKTKGGSKLRRSLMGLERPKGWEEALAHRNKLLDFQQNSEQRTHVTDDDSDYFNTSSVWLSAGERDKLEKYQQEVQEKKHASRLANKKITFDFAGRQVIEEKPVSEAVDEDVIREITRDTNAASEQYFTNDLVVTAVDSDREVAPGINPHLLKFDESALKSSGATTGSVSGLGSHRSRVQDAGLMEMSDEGRCLSMHQPWASLLVEGIKLHEGRTWYTPHRGRLWIASTAKPCDPDTARALEDRYRVLYPDKNVQFPSFYPSGCLLGCVHVEDCLPQEEYQKQYPDGESDSPYVLICSNPASLRLRFPVKGQHKIYTLEKSIHVAAVKCLQNMARIDAQKAKEAKAG